MSCEFAYQKYKLKNYIYNWREINLSERLLTEQEKFWVGEFGSEYINRNKSENLLNSKTALFSRVFRSTDTIKSCIEFGSNIGLNLLAIKRLIPDCEVTAVEINASAIKQLKKIPGINVYHQSILEYDNDYKADLSFVSVVLIHINPDSLDTVYAKLYNSSKKYILIAEYYNPTPVEVPYRGNKDKLFKRDFAGEMLDKYTDLKLIDYGFVYHRDNEFPLDDITWFLLSK